MPIKFFFMFFRKSAALSSMFRAPLSCSAASSESPRLTSLKSFLRSAADHVYLAVGLSVKALDALGGAAVAESETVKHAAHGLARSLRDDLVCLPAEFRDAAGHIPGDREARIERIDEGARRSTSRRHLRQLVVGVALPFAFPLAATLLLEPQPHYVLDKGYLPEASALVREAELPRLVGEDRLVAEHAHYRPGAA